MTWMEKEIKEQPAKLTESYEFNKFKIIELAKLIKEKSIDRCIVAARGSSDHAAIFFKYLMEIYTDMSVSLAAMSVLSLYKGNIKFNKTLVIGVSQSGGAADVENYLKVANDSGALTVAITNDQESIVAKAGQISLFMNVGIEKSVAATKTMTTEMYLLARIVEHLSLNKELRDSLDLAPHSMSLVFSLKEEIVSIAKKYKDTKSLVILGRGLNLAVAFEGALKIQETCYIEARGFAISDFHHGPFASIQEGSKVIILATKGVTFDNACEMIEKCKGIDADVETLTNDVSLSPSICLPLCDEIQAPFILMVALQLLALEISLCKSLNPDQPRRLKKVTVTL